MHSLLACTTWPHTHTSTQVVSIRGLTHGYHGRPLFKDVNLDIEKGDRVAIIGPNGAGELCLT